MKTQRSLWVWAVLASVPLLTFGQQFNLSPSYAGWAVALQVTPWQGDAVALAATGLVPPQGGQRANTLFSANPVQGVTAYQLSAATIGASANNHSLASLANLDATFGGHHMTAYGAGSEATATANFLTVSISGKSNLMGVMVDGSPVLVTGEANQTITFPDGYLIINEQSGTNSRYFGTITVNALHLLVDGVGSLVAGSSTAQVINAPLPNVVP